MRARRLAHAGRRSARRLRLGGGARRPARAISPASPIPSVDVLIEKIARGEDAQGADHRLPRARPRAARRALLGADVVQRHKPRRLLGQFSRPRRDRNSARARPDTWWFDPRRRQGSASRRERRCLARSAHDRDKGLRCRIGAQRDAWQGRSYPLSLARLMLAYIARILLMIPTMLGIMLISFVIVQFAPGGPVERIIAQLQGNDAGAARASPAGAAILGAARAQATGGDSRLSRRAGPRPEVHRRAQQAIRLRQAGAPSASARCSGTICASISARAISATRPVLQLIKEKLPVSMTLGLWMTLLSYGDLDSARHRARRCATARRFDTWTSAVVIIGYAIPGFLFAILLIVLFAGGSFWQIFPLRGLTSDNFAELPGGRRSLDYLWHIILPVTAMALGAFATTTLLDQEFLPRRDPQAICADRPHEGPVRAPRALRPRVPQRHADRRSPAFRAPSCTPSSPARC